MQRLGRTFKSLRSEQVTDSMEMLRANISSSSSGSGSSSGPGGGSIGMTTNHKQVSPATVTSLVELTRRSSTQHVPLVGRFSEQRLQLRSARSERDRPDEAAVAFLLDSRRSSGGCCRGSFSSRPRPATSHGNRHGSGGGGGGGGDGVCGFVASKRAIQSPPPPQTQTYTDTATGDTAATASIRLSTRSTCNMSHLRREGSSSSSSSSSHDKLALSPLTQPPPASMLAVDVDAVINTSLLGSSQLLGCCQGDFCEVRAVVMSFQSCQLHHTNQCVCVCVFLSIPTFGCFWSSI